MTQPIAIISADKEIVELAREAGFEVVGFFDPNPAADALGIQHLGSDERWLAARERTPGLRVALALDPPAAKRRALERYGMDSLASIVSKQAHVSRTASLGPGCIVQRNAAIMADARVGAACKINIGATVHHDCMVGQRCTLAPGSQLLGYVHIGDDVFVGAAATVMPKVRVGAGAVIGAGALVNEDVAAGATVAGVPAKPLVKR